MRFVLKTLVSKPNYFMTFTQLTRYNSIVDEDLTFCFDQHVNDLNDDLNPRDYSRLEQ